MLARCYDKYVMNICIRECSRLKPNNLGPAGDKGRCSAPASSLQKLLLAPLPATPTKANLALDDHYHTTIMAHSFRSCRPSRGLSFFTRRSLWTNGGGGGSGRRPVAVWKPATLTALVSLLNWGHLIIPSIPSDQVFLCYSSLL